MPRSAAKALGVALVLVLVLAMRVPAAPVRDTLIVVTDELGQTVDWNSPAGVHIPSVELQHNVYDRLIEFKMVNRPEGRVPDFTQWEPRLATSFAYSPDFKLLTVTLRRGVKSNYGNELGAEDVVYAAERAFGTRGFAMGAFRRVGVDAANQVVAKDPYTVEFRLPKPNPSGWMLFPLYSMGIIDSKEAKKHASPTDPWSREWLNKNHAGYGPYRITSWTDGEVVFASRPDYYRGAPSITRVIIKQVPDETGRATLVETGSADMSVDLSLKEIERIRGKSGVRIIDLPGNEHVFFSMNHRVAPFNNPKVREAMGYAIPVDPILRNVYFGRARPLKSEWPDTYPGVTDKFYRYRFDQARARQLMAEAGFPNGFRTTIMYSAIVAEAEQIAVIIRGVLAQVGVDATLERVTGAEFSVRLFGPRKETPAWLNATSKPMTPAIEYIMPIGWLCATPFNAAGYCNRRVDELYENLLEEGNAAKRRQIYDDIQRMIAEDNNTIGLAQWGHHAAMQANIAGYGWYTDGRLRLFDLRKQQ